jgi:hypothetical protein
LDELQDTFVKVRNFFTAKLEKNWKRLNEKLHLQKISAEDFQKVHLFMISLTDSLKVHFKIMTVNMVSISEDSQKRFFSDFKTKKSEELKQILDSEPWT